MMTRTVAFDDDDPRTFVVVSARSGETFGSLAMVRANDFLPAFAPFACALAVLMRARSETSTRLAMFKRAVVRRNISFSLLLPQPLTSWGRWQLRFPSIQFGGLDR